MEDEKKYKVMVGDPFGGYTIAGKDLSIKEAILLEKDMQVDLDYFTSTYIADKNGNKYHPTDEDRIGTLTEKERVFTIAVACHEAYRAFCQLNGDQSVREWQNAEQWQRENTLSTVKFLLDNPNSPHNVLHDILSKEKIDAGWVYGDVKDVTAKTHPCLVPFEELPEFQQKKDVLFCVLVELLR
jgi:hypothetical protein